MTRINTNVSSLSAQTALAQSNTALEEAMTRLSTGLRINTGKDDPAGLIASEALRSDIVSVQQAISNNETADQIIATADSALGEVASLLNDIRALVTEAANTGAMSDDQVAANQLQIDSSLDAINRISQTTSFQGMKLLDGTLGFNTTMTSGGSTVTDLTINQANFGTADSMSVDVNINAAATKAELSAVAATAAAQASTTVTLAESATVTGGTSSSVLNVWRDSLTGEAFSVEITSTDLSGDPPADGFNVTFASNKLTIDINSAGAGATAADVVAAIEDGGWELQASLSGNLVAADTAAEADSDASTLTFTAEDSGADFNDVSVVFEGGASNTASYDSSSKTITVTVNNTANQDVSDLAGALDTALDGGGSGGGFAVTSSEVGDTVFHSMSTGAQDLAATGNTLASGGLALADDLVLQVTGSRGTEIFTFEQYSLVSQMAAAINLVSDVTGVTASESSGTLTLNSVDYGSDATVSLEVIEEGASGTFETALGGTYVDTGTDIDATVNGYTAQGDGNTLSVNVATLQMSMTVSEGSSTDVDFTIDGGGALFQIGPDVVSTQQARLGIESVNVAKLDGESGKLYQLRSGQDAALENDAATAAAIVDEVINQVSSLRGRLGAFQATTLDSNINSLTDTLENLTAAESIIRDADFAEETAALTRAQILVQSGTKVLSIANSNPENVLTLLQ